jgi:hypothetical protein
MLPTTLYGCTPAEKDLPFTDRFFRKRQVFLVSLSLPCAVLRKQAIDPSCRV